MRFPLVVWVIFIFVATCTNDVPNLFLRGEINFVFVSTPDFWEFFQLYPTSQASKIETIGHFFMFFILTYLLLTVFKNKKKVLVIAISYGFLTEILQPFFNRGGVFYDFLADVFGVLALFSLYTLRQMIRVYARLLM